MQQVVVTGTASASGTRKIDTSFSITTATEEQLKMAAPSSTADVLKIVPGVYAESTGGQSGANIEVRGFPSGSDSPFVSVQMNGNPIYPVPVLSFFEGSSAFRLDDTIERVEVLRGGPSTIYSVGQPGATMNFIMKKGGDTPEGNLRFTTGTGNLRRVDGVYSGKIAEGWYGMIGGFYRTTNGVRDAGFPADDGGQLSASLTRKLDQGELTVYARSTSDKNAFYTGVPLISSNNGHTISSFPGFDPLTGTLMSNEMRNFTVEAGPGKTLNYDLGDGRGLNSTLIGADFQQKLNGWDVSNKLNYFSGNLNTIAMFTGNNPLTAADYLAQAIAANNGNAATVAAAGGVAATGGAITYAERRRGGRAEPAGGAGRPVGGREEAALLHRRIPRQQGHRLQQHRDRRRLRRQLLLARRLVPRQQPPDDGRPERQPDQREAEQRRGGVEQRHRRQRVLRADRFLQRRQHGRVHRRRMAHQRPHQGRRRHAPRTPAHLGLDLEPDGADTDNNPLTVYNNGTSQPNGSYTGLSRSDSANSFTVGGLYKLTRDSSVFVRANQGHTFIYFDDLRNAGTQDVVNDRNRVPNPKVTQYEVGFKTATPLYSAYVNAFFTDFTGISFQQITTTDVLYSVSGSKGKGVEFELALRPIAGLQLQLTGDWQDSEYKDNPTINGNAVQRQPKFQYRFSPSYRIPVGDMAAQALRHLLAHRQPLGRPGQYPVPAGV
jgi:iron complex outermembrane receptor protein